MGVASKVFGLFEGKHFCLYLIGFPPALSVEVCFDLCRLDKREIKLVLEASRATDHLAVLRTAFNPRQESFQGW